MACNFHRFRLLTLVLVLMLVSATAAVGWTFATNVGYTGNRTELEEDASFEVKLQYFDEESDKYLSTKEYSAFSNALWCPGRTEIVYLKVVNNEEFPVKVKLDMVVTENGFDDVMSYSVIKGDLKAANAVHPTSWTNYVEMAGSSETLGKKTYVLLDNTGEEEEGLLVPRGEACLALAIHMDESASSDYANKHMNLHFNLQVDADYAPGSTPTPAN